MADTTTVPAAEPGTLAALIDAYLGQYEGRDRTRPKTLAFWREQLKPDRRFAEITDEDVLAGLDGLRSRPARVYVGRDAEGRPTLSQNALLCPS